MLRILVTMVHGYLTGRQILIVDSKLSVDLVVECLGVLLIEFHELMLGQVFHRVHFEMR